MRNSEEKKTLLFGLVALAAMCSGCSLTPAQDQAHPGAQPNVQACPNDGSYAGIAKTITEGVSQPKEYRSPMPPMGGAQLTPDQVSALAAYVWSFSHK
jgi:mono/diheme cytochrome c family protein